MKRNLSLTIISLIGIFIVASNQHAVGMAKHQSNKETPPPNVKESCKPAPCTQPSAQTKSDFEFRRSHYLITGEVLAVETKKINLTGDEKRAIEDKIVVIKGDDGNTWKVAHSMLDNAAFEKGNKIKLWAHIVAKAKSIEELPSKKKCDVKMDAKKAQERFGFLENRICEITLQGKIGQLGEMSGRGNDKSVWSADLVNENGNVYTTLGDKSLNQYSIKNGDTLKITARAMVYPTKAENLTTGKTYQAARLHRK